LFEKILSDGLACRLLVFFTKVETFHNYDLKSGLPRREEVLKQAER